MRSNQDYKNASLESLRGNWAPSVAAAIVVYLILFLCSSPMLALTNPYEFNSSSSLGSNISLVLQILVIFPLVLGLYNSFKCLYINSDNRVLSNTFSIGFGRYGHNVLGILLMDLFIFLWSLLLIIPGIIKAYSYAMTPYILVDEPELSANQAIEKSMAMMKGHKFDLFYLHLSFIGWIILSIITCGIGLLWLLPYMYVAQAAFYSDLKAEYETRSINI